LFAPSNLPKVILLLFRKTDSSVARFHFAGNTYTIQP
jgi:hypothetical protein